MTDGEIQIIGFLWDGTRFVIGIATNSPKMQALSAKLLDFETRLPSCTF